MKGYILILILFAIFMKPIYSQQDSTFGTWDIEIDSIVVTAAETGFNIEKLIRIAQNDTTFYIAFKNLRNHAFRQIVDAAIMQSRKAIPAHWEHKMNSINDSCFQLTKISGNIDQKLVNRKGEYRFMTLQLIDELFLNEAELCNEKSIFQPLGEEQNRIDSYKNELKKLLFMTGTRSDIPFIGRKTAIFDEKMRPYYRYKLEFDSLSTGKSIVFLVSLNHENSSAADNTVVKYLKTWYRMDDFQVLRREYHLQYETLPYDFDVKMEIDLEKVNGDYYPRLVKYDGQWDVMFKKEEKGSFTIKVSDFKSD